MIYVFICINALKCMNIFVEDITKAPLEYSLLGSSVGHASYDITFTTATAGDFVHLFSLTQITDCSIRTAGHLHFPVILPSLYQTNVFV